MLKIIFSILLTIIPFFANAADFISNESSRCSRYFGIYEKTFGIPNNLVKAVSLTESGRSHKDSLVAWPWVFNAEGKGYRFNTKTEAVAAIKKLQKQGVTSIDVGCMQVNLKHHPKAFIDINQALEPKYNIRYAASLLAENYRKHKSWSRAVSVYHSYNPEYGDVYLRKVYSVLDGLSSNATILADSGI